MAESVGAREREVDGEVDWARYLIAFVRFRREVGHSLRSVRLIPDWCRLEHKPGLEEALRKEGVEVLEWCSMPLLGVEESRWSPLQDGYINPEWICDIDQRFDEGIWD